MNDTAIIEVRSIGTDGEISILELKGNAGNSSSREIIALTGRIRRRIDNLIKDRQYKLIINLNGTGEVGKAMLGALTWRVREIQSHKGDIKFIGLDSSQKRYLEMVGVTRILKVYNTEEEAVRSFREGGERQN